MRASSDGWHRVFRRWRHVHEGVGPDVNVRVACQIGLLRGDDVFMDIAQRTSIQATDPTHHLPGSFGGPLPAEAANCLRRIPVPSRGGSWDTLEMVT
jgi:hypothetical protein